MFNYQSEVVGSILETSLDAIFTVDDQGKVVDLNAAAERMFGWSRPTLLGADVSVVIPAPSAFAPGNTTAPSHRESIPRRKYKHHASHPEGIKKDGSRFPIELSVSSFTLNHRRYVTGFVRDVSERKRVEERMRFLATHDSDTNFLNYRGFSALRVDLTDNESQVLVVRLDDFRHFVSAYGRHLGGLITQEFALRLQHILAPDEIVARIREDAFAILMPQDAFKRALTIDSFMKQPLTQGAMKFTFSITLGLSQATGTLLQRLSEAELAADQAEISGKGRLNQFNQDTCLLVRRERLIERRLRETIHSGGLSLAFQPKICLATKKCVGAEALVRWVDDEIGVISPGEFIPLAEKLGLIGNITEWVLERSLQEISAYDNESFAIAVNFSSLDFHQPDLVERINTALVKSKQRPNKLVVELTESVLVSDPTAVKSKMDQIKEFGASISLDDFGTGYSSLSYLRWFPLDSLKIDTSFVRDISESADAAAVTAAIVSLAKALDLETIAEGVESSEQAKTLTDLNVDLCQGYLYGRPISPREFRHSFSKSQLN